MDMLQLLTVCYFWPNAREFLPKACRPISVCQSMNCISDLGLHLMTIRSPTRTILPQRGLIAPAIGGDYKGARCCHGTRRFSRKATETCRANGSRGYREFFDRCRSGGRLALPEK